MKLCIGLAVWVVACSALADIDTLNKESGPSWALLGSARSSYKDAVVLTNDSGVIMCRLNRKGLTFNGLPTSSVTLGFESDKLISIDFSVSDHAQADKTLSDHYGVIDDLPSPMKGKIWDGQKMIISLQKKEKGSGAVYIVSKEYYMRQMTKAMEAANKALLESFK